MMTLDANPVSDPADPSANNPNPDAGGGKPTDPAASGGTALVEGGNGDGGKGPEGKNQGQPSGEGKPPVAGAEIEVKLPDGVKVDKVLMDAFVPVAKEIGLDSEKASKIAGMYASHQEATAKAQQEAFDRQDADWVKSIEADPDIGGANHAASVAAARAAVKKFGGDALAADLEKHGIGNLPSLVKAFVQVGRAIGEDTTHAKTAVSGEKPTRANALAKLYAKSQE
jgi:hypothetical protein